MKPLISCILTSFLFLSPFRILLPSASAQGWVWGRASTGAGLDAWQVATDASGNIYGGGIQIYAGSLSFGGIAVPPNAKSVWVKYDPSGTVLWADGTISGQTYLENITTDPSGNLIVFGSFSSVTMKIGPFTLTNSYSGSASQYYLAKISPSGTVLWAINDGNITPSYLILSIALMSTGGVTTDAAGNIYITSSFNKSSMTIGSNTLLNSDPSGKSYDIFVAKYSPAGTLVWASSIGGNDNDYGFGITVSGTGYIYVAGAFYSASIKVGTSVITNPYANSLAFIAKFSSAGTPSWAQSAGGINGAFAVGLAKDNSGNIYI